MKPSSLLRQIRAWVIFFMGALIISGITAFPVYTELNMIITSGNVDKKSALGIWLLKVWEGVKTTQKNYPFLFYGFDWLAFAHLVIAILFIGVYRHPVRNKWIIQWAIITCICILPLALIAGTIRGIPLIHILIDCSFGVIGLIPLLIINKKIQQLKKFARREE